MRVDTVFLKLGLADEKCRWKKFKNCFQNKVRFVARHVASATY